MAARADHHARDGKRWGYIVSVEPLMCRGWHTFFSLMKVHRTYTRDIYTKLLHCIDEHRAAT
jgi:hypothetical protein